MLEVNKYARCVRWERCAPCWCPPKSYVVNFTFPIASSSDAKIVRLRECVIVRNEAMYWDGEWVAKLPVYRF